MDLAIVLSYELWIVWLFMHMFCYNHRCKAKQDDLSGFVERNFVEDFRSFLCTLHFGLDSYRQLCGIVRRGLVKGFSPQILALPRMLALPQILALPRMLVLMFVHHLEDARFLRDGGKCRPSFAVGRRDQDGGDVVAHCNE